MTPGKRLNREELERMHQKRLQPFELDPELDPWEQQPGEPTKYFLDFVAYRDMGESRSLKKLGPIVRPGRAPSKSTGIVGTIARLSGQYRWVERAQAWDHHLIEVRNEQIKSRIKEMADIEVDLAYELLDKLKTAVSSMDAGEMDAKDLVKAIEIGVKTSRLVRGKDDGEGQEVKFTLRIGDRNGEKQQEPDA